MTFASRRAGCAAAEGDTARLGARSGPRRCVLPMTAGASAAAPSAGLHRCRPRGPPGLLRCPAPGGRPVVLRHCCTRGCRTASAPPTVTVIRSASCASSAADCRRPRCRQGAGARRGVPQLQQLVGADGGGAARFPAREAAAGGLPALADRSWRHGRAGPVRARVVVSGNDRQGVRRRAARGVPAAGGAVRVLDRSGRRTCPGDPVDEDRAAGGRQGGRAAPSSSAKSPSPSPRSSRTTERKSVPRGLVKPFTGSPQRHYEFGVRTWTAAACPPAPGRSRTARRRLTGEPVGPEPGPWAQAVRAACAQEPPAVGRTGPGWLRRGE